MQLLGWNFRPERTKVFKLPLTLTISERSLCKFKWKPVERVKTN